jgi:hypothetical protein
VKVFSNVEHPRLPEVFAQAGSIFSGLMAMGILFSLINNKLMRTKLIDDIGSMYFSNFSSLNHYGKKSKS